MSTGTVNNDETLVVPDAVIQAAIRRAERQAEMVIAAFDEHGLFPQRPVALPAGFLLELGAVMELGLWERQGLRAHLDSALPTYREATYREATDAFLARAKQGAAAFGSPETVLLHNRVLRVWMEHFAWDGPDILQAELILGDVDDEEFANMLADFVWQHRHDLSKLLDK
jgi:hypothetical protein